jgi:hypothetical protein
MAPRFTPPGALPNPSPSSATTPVPLTTQPPVPPPSSPRAPHITSLSPEALPFVPSGRSKAQRWQDSTPSVFDGEVARLLPRCPALPAGQVTSASCSTVGGNHRPSSPPPPLCSVVGFCNLRPVQIDKDGSCLVERKRSRCRPAPQTRRRHHPRRSVPEDLWGRCFNCFSR